MRNTRGGIAVLILLAAIFGCSRFQSATRQEYRKDGVAFAHLSNWTINEDQAASPDGAITRYLTVEGPGNAVFMLTRFPAEVGWTLETYADTLHRAMGEESKNLTGGYEVVKMGAANSSPTTTRIAGATRQGLRREFDLKALGVPVPHRAEYYLLETGREKWIIVAQAPTEDWDGMREGLQVIFDSLAIGADASAGGGK